MGLQIMSYMATGIVLLGVYFISKPRLLGQYLMLVADAVWLVYAGLTDQWALGLQSLALFLISVTAVYNWRKQKIPF